MANRLYPPTIENTLPAFYGTSLEVPFKMNSTVGKDSIEGFILQLRSLTSNSIVINNLTTNNYDIEQGVARFSLSDTQINKLNIGQYYRLQIAYLPKGYSGGGKLLGEQEQELEVLKNINYINSDVGVTQLKSQFQKIISRYYNSFHGADEQKLIATGDIQGNWEQYWDESIEYTLHQQLIQLLKNTAFDVDQSDQDRIDALLDLYDQETDTANGYANIKTYYNALYQALDTMQNNYIKSDAIQASIIQSYFQEVANSGVYNKQEIEEIAKMTDNAKISLASSNFVKQYTDLCNIMAGSTVDKFNEVKSHLVSLVEDSINSAYKSVKVDDTYPVVGYYSITAVIKYTGIPTVKIQNLLDYKISSRNGEFVGQYENSDLTERVKKYSFAIYDENGNTVDSVNDQIHNNESDTRVADGQLISIDNYNYPIQIERGKVYTVQYSIETMSGLKLQSPQYKITRNNYLDLGDVNTNFIIKPDLDNGCVALTFSSSDAIFQQGTFILSRSHETNGKIIKEKLKRVNLGIDLTEKNPYIDNTIEHGIKYQYILERINQAGIYSQPIYATTESGEKYITANFEDIFLSDGKRQLRVRYNPKVSSFKQDVLESKTETIGSKYPFIFRNGSVSYKEFPISGLILRLENDKFDVAQLDRAGANWRRSESHSEADLAQIPTYSATDLVDENMKAEREFKLAVLDWLTNGEPKLFRSPAEGNYIVRLMNISLSPEDKLSRMLHTFTCTAYEVAACNNTNLTNYQIIENDSDISESVFVQSSYAFTEADWGKTNLFGDLGVGIQSVKVEAYPANINSYILIDNRPVAIGATGKYELPYGITCNTIGLPMRNAPSHGTITISYKTYQATIFDQIKDVGITQCPAQTVLGHSTVAGDFVSNPLLTPGNSSDHIKESISAVKYLRFMPRPVEYVTAKKSNIYRAWTTANGYGINVPNMSVLTFPYISRLPVYFIKKSDANGLRQNQLLDLSYTYRKGTNNFEFQTTTLPDEDLPRGFREVVIKYKTGDSSQFMVASEKILEINGIQEIKEIKLGPGVYMEIGYEQVENIYLTEEMTTDESLQAAKDALAQATTDLLNYRDQKYNENFVDENGFTQEYMNWYAQRIVLERRYDFAKAQYELALKKVIEQS